MSAKTNDILTGSLSAVLILLFIYTGITKLIDRKSLENILAHIPVIESASHISSWLLPIAELIIAGLLFFPSLRLAGFLTSFILMTAFTSYIGMTLLFAAKLPCACGGVLQQLSWMEHLVFNILFTLLAFVGWRIAVRSNKNIAIQSGSASAGGTGRKSRIPV